MAKRRKRYAGEGMPVNEFGESMLARPLRQLRRIGLFLIGRKSKDQLTLTRDFYAAITSEPNYVILGEQRYGMTTRIASVNKPKPSPPKAKGS
jgi:hypothetical protein